MPRLFRPYERPGEKAAPSGAAEADAVSADPALVRTTARQARPTAASPATPVRRPAATVVGRTDGEGVATGEQGTQRKDRPTPTRRQAEAARMARLHPTLTKKEIQAQQRQRRRETELKAFEAEENRPEKVLLRNYIDAHWHIGEWLLPIFVAILFLPIARGYLFPGPSRPGLIIDTAAQLAAPVLVVAAIVDAFLTWRGYRRLVNQRYPGASLRGFGMYTFTRLMQLRPFRHPKPAVKRGEAV